MPLTNNNLAFGISAGRPHSKTVKKIKEMIHMIEKRINQIVAHVFVMCFLAILCIRSIVFNNY